MTMATAETPDTDLYVADHHHMKPWVTDPRDRAYLNKQLRRLDEVNDERKRLIKRIEHREHEAWDNGGRELYLAAEVERAHERAGGGHD